MTNDSERYGMTPAEIGEFFEVGSVRIREIQAIAMRKMRKRASHLADDAADLGHESGADPHIRVGQCADCLEELSDRRRARCSRCEATEEARKIGYEEGRFALRAYATGVKRILSRWPGTTT